MANNLNSKRRIWKPFRWIVSGINNFFFLYGAFRKYKGKYLTLLKADATKTDIQKADLEKLDNLRQMQDLLHGSLLKYLMALIILILLSLVLFFLPRVNRTTITADLYVSSVNFTNTEAIENNPAASFEMNRLGGRMDLINCRAEEFDDEMNSYSVIPDSGTLIRLPGLSVPRRSKISLEQPFFGYLRLTVAQPDTIDRITLMATADHARLKSEAGTLDTLLTGDKQIQSGPVTFSKRKHVNRKFMLLMDQVQYFQLKGFNADDITFQDVFESSDPTNSSILSGVIRLNDTKEDTISLNEGDKVVMKFVNQVKMKLTAAPNGLHIRLQGEVSQLKTGAGIQNEGEKEIPDRMPRQIKVYYDQEPWLWVVVITLLPILLSYLIRPRRQL